MVRRLCVRLRDVLRRRVDYLRPTGWRTDYLARLQYRPRTVFDVGAAQGSGDLLELYPEAYCVLIDPLPCYEAALRRILEGRAGEYVPKAAGSRPGRMVIRREPYALMSSLLPRTVVEPGGPAAEEREVEVTTLDELLRDGNYEPPFGLKIDTEGYEREVIGGAAELLRRAEFVLAEVSVAQRFEDSYSFAEFIALMDGHGLGLRELLDIGRNPRGDLTFLDLVFDRRGAGGP